MTVVPLEPHVLTPILFTSVPPPCLLGASRQIRQEALDFVIRETRATMIDAWDCRGHKGSKVQRPLPQPILERIQIGDILLNLWTPIENDIGMLFLQPVAVQALTLRSTVCTEVMLSYVSGIRELRILFNNSTVGRDKLQVLQEQRIVQKKGPGCPSEHEIRFVKNGEDIDFKDRVCVEMALIGSVC